MEVLDKFTIGIDFGTESARVVLVSTTSGQLMAAHSTPYRHGVLSRELPTGESLGFDWALQHPKDYIDAIRESIPSVLKESGVAARDVIGIGIDFTSCTILPIDEQGTPLCLLEAYRRRPHSWPKLWKHHAADAQARLATSVAEERGGRFLDRYGGRISSEWMVPKVLQVLTEDPEIYRVADKFVEAGDWITLCLTGRLVRNAGGAGFKALWHARDGYPPTGYFRALHPELEDLVDKKLAGRVVPVGSNVGGLSKEMASSLGLLPGTPVAAAVIDAFAAVPGLGVAQPGKMVLAMGTSTCHMLLADREEFVPGMTGVVQNGIIPGYYGYEAGQAAVGDIFGWFAQHGVPPYVLDSARREGISTFDWLERRADSLVPGESGLLALDWWNGNRMLADTTLSGVIIGYTLATKPEEIYRALLESTAFGTRMIIEQFEEKGLEVNTLHVGGGIAQKNRLLMQIYADVTGKRVYVSKMNENVALGSALFGAVAAGHGAGGYDSVQEAIEQMISYEQVVYHPNASTREVYHSQYKCYADLHHYFGKQNKSMMYTLRQLRDRD